MSTAVSKEQQQPQTLKALITGEQFKSQLALVTAKHVTPERIVRVALTAMLKNPKLAECDQASFCLAILNLASYGLEPNGRQAHLIPFENRAKGIVECQLILDYKGIAELVMRSGLVSNIHADIVCENDEFIYETGVLTKHKANYRQGRGKVYAVYTLVRMKDGTEKCDVMSLEEVEAIRARSKSGKSGPWVSDWNEMAKKTVFKRCSKWLPLSPEIRDAIEGDNDYIEGEVVKPQKKARTLADLSDELALPAPQDPETPEQAFRRCLAEIGPMDAKAANEHIKTFDTGEWREEWGFELTAALEAKASK